MLLVNSRSSKVDVDVDNDINATLTTFLLVLAIRAIRTARWFHDSSLVGCRDDRNFCLR